MAPQQDPATIAMPRQYCVQDPTTTNSHPQHVDLPRHPNMAHKTLTTNPPPRHLNMACKTLPLPTCHCPLNNTSYKTPPPPTHHVAQEPTDPPHPLNVARKTPPLPPATPSQCGTQDPATADPPRSLNDAAHKTPPRHPITATLTPAVSPPTHHMSLRLRACHHRLSVTVQFVDAYDMVMTPFVSRN
ncbi:hypothetical protein EDB85DRAFT_2142920 [Lactarius pseudohatsudake]|nr:hypothetical protein EDB85DRAFT_2142920 [Lactarius pseudohatsudake]